MHFGSPSPANQTVALWAIPAVGPEYTQFTGNIYEDARVKNIRAVALSPCYVLVGFAIGVRMMIDPPARSHRGPKPAGVACRHIARRRPRSGLADFLIAAIGAYAGGLDACRKLAVAMSDNTGMTFILVQHLDANHDSLVVDLLSSPTKMKVSQAVDARVLAHDHRYIIPPGAYVSVTNGMLHLSEPAARQGACLPFDFLRRSLAEDCAEHRARYADSCT